MTGTGVDALGLLLACAWILTPPAPQLPTVRSAAPAFLRLTPKLHALQLGQQQLQMLNLALPRDQLLVLCQDQRSQRICGKSVEIGQYATADMRGVSHERARFHPQARKKSCAKESLLAGYTDSCVAHAPSSGCRQSMPSSSIDNCARVNETSAASPLAAKLKRPRSNLLFCE